jgi:hypothetical protein
MKLENRYNLNSHLLDDGDDFRIGWSQDCAGVLERNKIIRDAQEGRRFAPEIEHIASIPSILVEKWMRENNMSWPLTPDNLEFIVSKVENDPEFKHFRTSPTR